MRLARSALFLALAGASLGAIAGPECTKEPKGKWMSEEAFKKMVGDQGYTIQKFKVTSGNCYEIYGKDKAGKRVEIYFSPVDGTPVKSM